MDISTILNSAGGIITAFATLLTAGGGLGFLIARKAYRKQKNNEADNIAIEGLKQANEDIRKDNARLRELLETERSRNAEAEAHKDAKIEKLYDEKNEEREGRVTAESGFCRHFGCMCREPAIGQGREWIEAHKDEPALGVDYLPINMLIKQYGERKKRGDFDITENEEKETKTK